MQEGQRMSSSLAFTVTKRLSPKKCPSNEFRYQQHQEGNKAAEGKTSQFSLTKQKSTFLVKTTSGPLLFQKHPQNDALTSFRNFVHSNRSDVTGFVPAIQVLPTSC